MTADGGVGVDDIERRLRRQRAGPRLREAGRAAQSRPIWERMGKALALWQPRVLPASRLGKALTYGSERWKVLCRYVGDGQVEIDSNWCYAARGINGVIPTTGLCRVESWNFEFPEETEDLETAHAA